MLLYLQFNNEERLFHSEFIKQKLRRAGKLAVMKAVEMIGQQKNGTWVLGPDVYIVDWPFVHGEQNAS